MLAAARHDEPVPPEVATRLDETLAGLRAETTAPAAEGDGAAEEPHRSATVVPLRRPSRLPRLVLAAAAVLVVGFGVTQVLDSATMQDSDSAGGGSTSAQDSGVDNGAKERGAAGPDAASDGEAPPPEAFVPLDELGIEELEPISPQKLDRDVAALEDTEEPRSALRNRRALATICGPRGRAAGSRTLAAAYDGRPTLVVYRAPEGGSQRVDLYLCDTEHPRRPFRSVTLPSGE